PRVVHVRRGSPFEQPRLYRAGSRRRRRPALRSRCRSLAPNAHGSAAMMTAQIPAVDRPSWDEYFMNIAKAVASRSTCTRRSVGALVVREKRILATGYNGAPAGLRHCDHTDGADMRDGHCARSTHAEQNAIVQAARHGTMIDGATVYCTAQPCLTCAK